MTSIFLSYARADDEPFVRKLHADLTAKEFDVWFDRHDLRSRGLTFHHEIRDAISASDRLVLVVGPNAARSEYVRQEWQYAWFDATKVVTPILRLGDYSILPDELKLLHCEDFRDDDQYLAHLKNLVASLSAPSPPLGQLIGVPSLPTHFLTRTELLRQVRDAVRAGLDSTAPLGGTAAHEKLLGIVGRKRLGGMAGMAGIGKSVLACLLAHDRKVREAFPDGIVWVVLGSLPNVAALQRRVHRDFNGDSSFQTEHEGKEKLKELFADKSVLLILDDAWRKNDVESFDVLGPKCRALITTRDAQLLTSLGGTPHLIDLLTDDEALRLLAISLGRSVADLPDKEAEALLKECGRLPLAVSLASGLIAAGVPWGVLLEAFRRHKLEFFEDDQRDNQHHDLLRAIEVSILALEPNEQLRLVELGVFPEDVAIPEAAVATLWQQTGLLDDLQTKSLLIKLKQRSLLHLTTPNDATALTVGNVSLHDLISDYCLRRAQQQYGNDAVLHEQLLAAYRKKCLEGWHTGPHDGYFDGHLVWHLTQAQELGDLHRLFRGDLGYAWFQRRKTTSWVADYSEDVNEAWEAVVKARESSHGLRGLELRCTLINSSLSTILRHFSDHLVLALVRCRIWQTRTALFYFGHNHDAVRRHSSLAMLLPFADLEARSEIVSQLFLHDKSDNERFWQITRELEAANCPLTVDERASVILALRADLPVLSDEDVQQAILRVRSLGTHGFEAKASNTATEPADVKSAIELVEFLEWQHLVLDEEEVDRVAALIPLLPDEMRSEIVNRLIAVTNELLDEDRRYVLYAVAPVASERQLLDALLCNPRNAAYLTSWLSSPRLMEAAVDCVRVLEGDDRLEVIEAIIPLLVPDHLRRLLPFASTIGDKRQREAAVGTLAMAYARIGRWERAIATSADVGILPALIAAESSNLPVNCVRELLEQRSLDLITQARLVERLPLHDREGVAARIASRAHDLRQSSCVGEYGGGWAYREDVDGEAEEELSELCIALCRLGWFENHAIDSVSDRRWYRHKSLSSMSRYCSVSVCAYILRELRPMAHPNNGWGGGVTLPESETWWADTLVSASKVLPEAELRNEISSALGLSSKSARAVALAALGSTVGSQELLEKMKDSFRAIGDPAEKCVTACRVSEVVPPTLREWVIAEALQSLDDVHDVSRYFMAMSHLLPCLSEKAREEMMEAAIARVRPVTIKSICSLTPVRTELFRVSEGSLKQLWSEASEAMRACQRRECLDAFEVVMFVLAAIEGADALDDVMVAIKEIGEWFP